MLKMNRDRDRILSAIRMRGPSVPVGIAKSVGISPLFASAFLSELRGEEKLRVSDMKVGSSPLYYLPGQEAMLENFIEHLNQKEIEAFRLLKNNKLLVDSEQTPVMRVALRAIKDFAVPLKINVEGEPKIFWKHFGVSDVEFEEIFKDRVLGGGKKERIEEIVKEEKEIGKAIEGEKLALTEEIKTEEKLIEEIKKDIIESVEKKPEEKRKTEKKRKRKKVEDIKEKEGRIKEEKDIVVKELKEAVEKKIQETEFGKNVKDYLSGRGIEVLEVIINKKKEYIAKIRVDHIFGKQEYFLIAKDKKNVSDNDLTVALQKAQSEKMPAIVMSLKELNKKGKEYVSQWGNLVKFEKMEFKEKK